MCGRNTSWFAEYSAAPSAAPPKEGSDFLSGFVNGFIHCGCFFEDWFEDMFANSFFAGGFRSRRAWIMIGNPEPSFVGGEGGGAI